MNLTKKVISAIYELKKNNLPRGKTSVQKIIYFTLPFEEQKKYYKPYHYGPYSETVQTIIRSLLSLNVIKYENNELEIKNKKDVIENEEGISRIINFFKSNKILSLKCIANISKIHYLYYHGKKRTIKEIKNFSKFIGWGNIIHLNDKKVEFYINLVKELN